MCFRSLLCVRIETDQLWCVKSGVIIHCLWISCTKINHSPCALMLDLTYNWPLNSELLLNTSLLELIFFFNNARFEQHSIYKVVRYNFLLFLWRFISTNGLYLNKQYRVLYLMYNIVSYLGLPFLSLYPNTDFSLWWDSKGPRTVLMKDCP